ncbi:MAG: type II CRISPR RNA-guided endonuclease Cas9 [Parasporobacterium sp.]|nr:type II CRISPR RNA-guided endonuclease Cas9 [Parasporobacterium sp.]
MKNKKGYYIGLDIGSNSVGYAVTDERYNLLKYRGEAMWGSHLFDEANHCEGRRGFRTARRRLDRRQQRVKLVDEIFAPEVLKIDKGFYIRKRESALYPEDSTDKDNSFLYFKDKDYDDKDYHKEYPTIHHLICALINEDRKFDIRLINIAVDWLVAHRGHFLTDVGEENVSKIRELDTIYNEFMDCFQPDDEYRTYPWDRVDIKKFGEILKIKGIQKKKTELKKFLYNDKIPNDEYFLNRSELINFLAGGKVSCNKLFVDSSYEDDFKITISEDMETLLPQLGDDSEIIAKAAAMYDWSILSELLSNCESISESKVKIYEKHKRDLKELKSFVKKYCSDKYYEIFRKSDAKLKNYTAYSFNVKSVKSNETLPDKKATREEFYDFLKKSLDIEKINITSDKDQAFIERLQEEIGKGEFLPKQVNTDNRVIPYQLYYVELKKILENASKHYSFLNDKDSEGYCNTEKLLSIFKFRIPYYVGPLRKDNSQYGWIERKAEGKIYPWNFEKMVDLDKSEDEFIRRMTNECTYIPGQYVLPKWSLLYSKYAVLNEINNIKINSVPITVEAKKAIYNDLFARKAKVSLKNIKEYMLANGLMKKTDELSGVDIEIKSSAKPYYDFKLLLDKGVLSEQDAEDIISRRTFAEDTGRFKKWIKDNYGHLDEGDIKYLGKLKYKEFGRLSKFFLCELKGASKETGETGSVLHFLWETNDNLMQILSNQYTFLEEIDEIRKEYYAENKMSFQKQMDNLGINNAVKRPVTRTMDVVKDVVSTMKYPPEKIFVEMARGEEEKARTKTRKERILEVYKTAKTDTKELQKQLEAMGDKANNNLQSDKLFLYYMQFGKSMYSGETIEISELGTKRYDVDHIYPQSRVKDDSILNNKVLVTSEENGNKGDVYPLDSNIRHKMHDFWKMLKDCGAITEEKYYRLIRQTPFSDSEKQGFINRQLVETRQSMKAVTQLLKSLYPNTDIVYVKARLAADFKQEFKFTRKTRLINDLHHAKDAYMNIVVGNVYNEKFTKRFAKKGFKFNDDMEYSAKTKTIFTHDLVVGEKVIWQHETDIPNVRRIYDKNNIHLTRYSYCKKGELFDQNPVKKGNGQAPLKKGMDIGKYGGYNKVSASFFALVRYDLGSKREVSIMPVDLMASESFLNDENFAMEYSLNTLKAMNTKKIENIDFPIGSRPIKIKTTFSLDGYRVWITGKTDSYVILSNAESLVLQPKTTEYVRNIENFANKKKDSLKIIHDEKHDGLNRESNIELYDILLNKMNNAFLKKFPGNQFELINSGREAFGKMDFEEQIEILLKCLDLLKTGRAGTVDMRGIGGNKKTGLTRFNSKLSNNVDRYSLIKIIDMSPAGLHTKESINLLDLLK